MKTLSQIPRNVSAKFCYDIDQLGQSENIESTDFVPYTFEDSSDTQDNSPKLTEEEQRRIDAQELDDIEKDLAAVSGNHTDAMNDFSSEGNIDTSIIPVSKFSIANFFAKNPLDENLMANVRKDIEDAEKLASSLGGYPQFEDGQDA